MLLQQDFCLFVREIRDILETLAGFDGRKAVWF